MKYTCLYVHKWDKFVRDHFYIYICIQTNEKEKKMETNHFTFIFSHYAFVWLVWMWKTHKIHSYIKSKPTLISVSKIDKNGLCVTIRARRKQNIQCCTHIYKHSNMILDVGFFGCCSCSIPNKCFVDFQIPKCLSLLRFFGLGRISYHY